MYRLKFSIETLSPVVLSAESNSTIMTGSLSEIGGSVIRGVLASRYVSEKNLGDNAHKDKDFQKLFYGGLKFLSAGPEISNGRGFVLPLSLQAGKKGTDGEGDIKDLLTEKEPPEGYKSFRGFGLADGDKIFTASASKNIFMHMSRSGEGERISGKSEDGNIYNYEALEEGQIFCGEILGEKSDLEKISDALDLENNFFDAYVGRSRLTQYGKCKFTFDKIEEIKIPDVGNKFYLRLESPLIPLQDCFVNAEKILQSEVIDAFNKAVGKNIFSLGKVFASGTEIENFVVPWGMKRPRVQAIAAGSVFEILTSETLTAGDKKIIGEKIYSGPGTRTEEGFGQLRFWEPKNFKLEKKSDNDKFEKPAKLSEITVKIANKILLERFLEQIRIYAHEDAKKSGGQMRGENSKHFFSRLDNILSTVGKKDVRKNFAEKISEESKDGSIFKDNLQNISLDGQKLFDILTGKAKLPYENRNLKKDAGENVEDLFREIDFDFSKFADDFCFEYLQNYFRYARKNTTAMKGGDNDE